MFISIVITCHNSAPHLRQCLESALENRHNEIIVLDDGSTDNSLDIASEYANRIIVKSQSNSGAQATRNELIKLINPSCNYVQYLDSDDYLHPHKIQTQLTYITAPNQIPVCDFTIDRGLQMEEDDNPYTERYEDFSVGKYPMFEALLRWEHIPQTNALLIPYRAFQDVSWDESYQAVHEHKLMFDLIKLGYEFAHTPFIGFVYRQCWKPGQINTKWDRRLAARERLLDEMFTWAEQQTLDLTEPLETIKDLTYKRLENTKAVKLYANG